ncbi:MAG TPA: hypothetical protein VIM64_18660 [Puia sp.]
MIIPATIHVQVVDKRGAPNPIEHVLLGLKIFTNNGSWHNYSPLKTDASGKVVVNDIRRLLELYNDEGRIIKDLKKRQVDEADISRALVIAKNKMEEDAALYRYIEKAVNHTVHAEPEKTEGVWKDGQSKWYQFTIEKIAKES